MKNGAVSFVTLLLWLCTSVLAAPPLNTPSSPQLSVTNWTFPLISNISHNPFPPYPDLPDVFFYKVPDSNIVLKFINCNRRLDRNETLVQEVLVDAILDSLRVDKYTPMPDYEHDWEAGDVVLLVRPEEEQERTLTWTRWTTTLRGLRNFIRAYPGVDFEFEIFLHENQRYEWWIGIGQLFSDDSTSSV